MTLKEDYAKIVTRYVEAFLDKQDFKDEFGIIDYTFVGDDVGGVVWVSDYFLNFNDIRIDIDQEAAIGEIFKWDDYVIDCHNLRRPAVNYTSWLKGLR